MRLSFPSLWSFDFVCFFSAFAFGGFFFRIEHQDDVGPLSGGELGGRLAKYFMSPLRVTEFKEFVIDGFFFLPSKREPYSASDNFAKEGLFSS